jgi:hypothetical protein
MAPCPNVMARQCGCALTAKLAGRYDTDPAGEDDERMRSRWLVIGAAVWTAGYGGVCLAVIAGQGSAPAWWYVALLVGAAGSLVVASAGQRRRPILIVAAAMLAVAALAGVLSIGMLLVPAVVATAVAAAGPSRRRQSGQPAI